MELRRSGRGVITSSAEPDGSFVRSRRLGGEVMTGEASSVSAGRFLIRVWFVRLDLVTLNFLEFRYAVLPVIRAKK